MVRNFVTGVVLGGVVAAGGLVVVSQIAPIKVKTEAGFAEGATPEAAVEEPAAPPETLVTPSVEPSEAQPKIADPAPLAEAPAEADEPLLRPLTNGDAPPPALVVPDLALPAGSGPLPEVEAAPPATAETVTEPAEATEPEKAAPETEAAALAPTADPEAAPATATEAPAMVEVPAVGQAPDAPAPEMALAPRTIVPDAPRDEKTVDGVTTGRLPSIGATAEQGAVSQTAETATPGAPAADLPPIRRFAQAFENPQAKPLFAILLIDSGAPSVPRAELAALPFPVTFVLDPLANGAVEAEAIYRAAGQEVVMLATAIPKGATASDLEQSFAGMAGKLQESVALIDTARASFQEDGKLSAEVVTLLADQGRGLVTFDRGLNAADQVARREGLPAATIYRSLDEEGEEAPLIRRYLDRAAFKAAQEGRVAVIGTIRPETITALMEWTVEGRASSVALAPITALMQGQ